MKIRYKILLLFTLLVTAIISFLGFSVYYFSSLERKVSFDKRLRGRANFDIQLYHLLGDSRISVLRQMDSSVASSLYTKSVAIYDGKGKELYHFESAGAQPLTGGIERVMDTTKGSEQYFTINGREAIAMHRMEGNTLYYVMVAARDEDGFQRLEKLRGILFISLIAGILLTALAGLIFSRQLVSPIAQIIYEVKDISSYNLSRRIKAGSGQDELNQLANTFNDLLGRLQESFDIQRRFISDASHEISTPLTSISSQLEVTLQKERNANEYQEVIQSVSEDVQQMRQLTKSLLEIAKMGSQGGIELNEVRVDEVLMKVTADVKKLSTLYNIDLNFGEFPEEEKEFQVFGNSDLLYSALKNIVENGCKYSPDKTSLVYLDFSNGHIYIRVYNKGDIIAADEIQLIFQPFYRGRTSKGSKGFGLGLALAKRIISLHQGSLEVTADADGITCFSITLPSLKLS